MSELDHFRPDYNSARAYFRELAEKRDWKLYALAVDEAEGLFIDVALWRGSSKRLVIHTSGVHGVEAFPGSAVQCAFLSSWQPKISPLPSIALIHCINPFGMRFLRRWNAQNVDLNRNFLSSLNTLPSSPFYDRLSNFLNPQSSRQLSWFALRALKLLVKHRFSALQQAIAQGQYSNPKGLFFGGRQPATETTLLLSFVQQHLIHYPVVRGIDFHTGLGKFGQPSIFMEPHLGLDALQQAESIFNRSIISANAKTRQSYQTQGSLVAGLKALYSDKNFWMVTQEVGTVGPIKILQALRRENFNFHHQLEQQQKAGILLKKVFSPGGNAWQRAAVHLGYQALTQLINA